MIKACAVLAALLAALAAGAAARGAIGADVVTIRKGDGLTFSGTVSSRAAGETIAIEFKRCRDRWWRVVGGAQTASGGAYFAEVRSFPGGGSGSWRARWGNVTSAPLVDLRPLGYVGWNYRRGRMTFDWYLGDSTQYIGGRPVQLQRKTSAGSWVLVRTARLARLTGRSGYWFRATFAVRRGLTVRVFAPRKTAAPCFRAWAGPEIRDYR